MTCSFTGCHPLEDVSQMENDDLQLLPQNGQDCKSLKDCESPTSCHMRDNQPPHLIPDQAARGPIQPGLEPL